jgi:PKD repeat protein
MTFDHNRRRSPVKHPLNLVCIAALVFGGSAVGQDVTIRSKDCVGKTEFVIDRDEGEGTGTPCDECPCESCDEYMGIKGIYYTPEDGEIWYDFPGPSAKYTIGYVCKSDGDGYAPYKIYVNGELYAEGTVPREGGEMTHRYDKEVCIDEGDEIRIWLESDYSTGGSGGKHGNYGRFRYIHFYEVGTCTEVLQAAFSASSLYPGPAPQTIEFDASASVAPSGGSIEEYGWDFGDGESGSGQTVSHTYDSDGEYTVTLTVTDNEGATESATKTVTLGEQPPVSIKINVGGSESGDFMADRQWDGETYGYDGNGSTTVSMNDAVSGTDNDAVFQSVRYQDFTYKVAVPAEGEYTVELLFADFWRDAAGGRVFGATVEGVDYGMIDVYDAVGSAAAHVVSGNVTVSDGVIDIAFERDVSDPILNGIVVREAEPSLALPSKRASRPTAAVTVAHRARLSLSVSGLRAGDVVACYGASGRLLYRATATGATHGIDLGEIRNRVIALEVSRGGMRLLSTTRLVR